MLRLFERPWLALLVGGALFVLAQTVGGDEWLVVSQPTAARLFGGSVRQSQALFFAGCLLVVAAGRWLPAWRERVHVVLGAAWFFGVCGFHYGLGLVAVTILVHCFGARLHSHVAMFLAAALLLVGARFVFGPMPANRLWLCMVSLRIVYYAFELRSIRRSQRSLIAALAYGPFSLLLWPGPMMISYLTYASTRPRAELDRLGAQQLLAGAGKLVLMALLLGVLHRAFHSAAELAQLSRLARAGVVLSAYPLVFFSISVRQDLAAALCNFSGHYAPSSFHLIFLADTPVEHVRRWNVHVVDFLRRTFVYETARHWRSMLVLILAACLGTTLFHTFMGAIIDGPDMKLGETASASLHFLARVAAGMMIGVPIARRRRAKKWWSTLLLTVLTQLGAALMFFTFHNRTQLYDTELPPTREVLRGLVHR